MTYIKVKWIHSNSNEPILLYSEIDEERMEQRKVEIFADGRYDYASSSESAGSTRLGEVPIPALSEIASDPQFEPVKIPKQEFEEVWEKRRK
jgi:hypothetical protein